MSRLGLLFLFPALLLAQETRGTINGRVTDPQSAAVPGARVVVADVETGRSTTLTTNDTGYFEEIGRAHV